MSAHMLVDDWLLGIDSDHPVRACPEPESLTCLDAENQRFAILNLNLDFNTALE